MDPRVVWLVPYLTLQSSYDSQIQRILQSSADSARAALRKLAGKPGIGAAVRRAQLTQVETTLHQLMAQLFQNVGNMVAAGQHAAAARALSAGFDWDAVLLRAVYGHNTQQREAMRRNLVAQAPRNIEGLITRLRHGGLPLSQQVYRTQALAQGWVNTAINNALGRGASWAELAGDVYNFINPGTPGGASYAAKRLARTEINNAYHSMAAQDAQDKPWVNTMTWHLSNSHPKPDICNALAGKQYAPASVPAKPHPQCFCYVVPTTVSAAQFLAAYRAGEYDDYMRRAYGAAAA